MGWVIQRKKDFLYTLGPNLRQEFFDDIVSDLTDSVVDPDVHVALNKPAFWGVKKNDNYIFNHHCNWHFLNLS